MMKRWVVSLFVVLALSAGVVAAQPEAQSVVVADTRAVEKVFTAWQPFQGGVMMWFQDTRQIWVFTNTDSRVTVYPDLWNGSSTVNVTAPVGLFTPQRGFGAIWQALGGSSGLLRWAMSPEVGYDSGARRVVGSELQIDGPGDTEYGVTMLPNSNTGIFRVIDIG